jgi:hypothetical protein
MRNKRLSTIALAIDGLLKEYEVTPLTLSLQLIQAHFIYLI